jgi:hypothetical protein
MSQNAIDGYVWGDFIMIFQISQYLQRPIFVWCKTSIWIMMKCGEEYNPIVWMHLVFGNQDFDPIETIISFSLQSEI